MDRPTALQYIEKARELHESEGEVEIDDLASMDEKEAEDRVSRSEDGADEIGAYVKAWVWVNRLEIQPDYADSQVPLE